MPIAPALRGRGQRDLAPERGVRLVQRHGMTRCEDTCGFQPGRTAADDDAPFRFRRGCDPLRGWLGSRFNALWTARGLILRRAY